MLMSDPSKAQTLTYSKCWIPRVEYHVLLEGHLDRREKEHLICRNDQYGELYLAFTGYKLQHVPTLYKIGLTDLTVLQTAL